MTPAEIGHSGSRSVKITSEQGADASWSMTVPVRARTEYRLTGWIKTESLHKTGSAYGALLNVHELQDAERGGTKALSGDTDWTQVQLNFNSGPLTEITINCLFGGWGRAVGTAWFDDIEFREAPGAELAGEVGRVVRLVTSHYAQRGPVDRIVPILAALKSGSTTLAMPVLDGLVSGWPEGKAPTLGEGERKTLTSLMESMPELLRDRLLALAQRWGEAELFGANIIAIIDSLKKQIVDSSLPDDQRAGAAKRLIGLSDKPEIVESMLAQVSLLSPPSLANGLINALVEGRNPETGRALISHWTQLSPSARRTAIAALMRRSDWAMALLEAVEKGNIQKTDLAAEHWSQLKQNPNRTIAGRAERLGVAGGAISADREEIVKKLLPIAKEKGDLARGKEVYTANCANCHAVNGQGGKIGPDLSGIGIRDRTEILLDILDPNRSVEANYRLWNITTKDGETYSGRLEAETQSSVEVLDIAGQKHVVQRKDMASMESSQLSIMPSGFEALPPEDLKSLLEFLAQAHP